MSNSRKLSKSKIRNKTTIYLGASITAFAVLAILSTSLLEVDKSVSSLNSNSTVTTNPKADTIKAPTQLNVSNVRVGETDLSWVASNSTYTTGYRILRSNNIYGPWNKIGEVSGRDIVKFTDTTSAANSWFYRVEAVYGSWQSVSVGYEAPPPVGREFFDSFLRSGQQALPLDGQRTEDGKSVWQVWGGEINSGHGIAISISPTGTRAIGVVRTPVHDGTMFAEDFDGAERLILRGKDPDNYLYVGSADHTAQTGLAYGSSFEIGEVRDGVVIPLKTGTTGGLDKDVRIEVSGSTIKGYIDAKRDDEVSGTLLMTAETSFLQDDPDATYFGIGFTRPGFGINDFSFKALQ